MKKTKGTKVPTWAAYTPPSSVIEVSTKAKWLRITLKKSQPL